MRPYPRAPVSATAMKILVHANSLGAGVGASSAGAWWPERIKSLFPLAGKPVMVVNAAVGGMAISVTASNMTAHAAANIDPYLSATAHNVLIVHEFINELRENGVNAANAFAAFKSYCLARRAAAASAGKRLSIIVCTTTPCYSPTNGPAWSAQRMAAVVQCNQWMREQYRDFSDVLCDVANYEPFRTMYASGNWITAAYIAAGVYQRSDGQADDYTHLGDTGYAVMAFAIARAIARVRAK